jgi:hypothetical protein
MEHFAAFGVYAGQPPPFDSPGRAQESAWEEGILGSRQTYGEVSLKTEEELRLQAESLDLRRLL